MFDLSGKKAVITGASGGIGRSIVSALHARGADCVISATRLDVLHDLSAELGENVHVVGCDLSDRGEIDALISESERLLGGIDILVNNAGMTRDGLSLRMKDADWEDILRVNLSAPFYLTRGFLRGMVKRRHGRIIFMSSIIGFTGNVGQANYAASKAALGGMCKSLAREFGSRGITVNCVAPGFIDTAMTAHFDEARKKDIIAQIPLARLGNGEDVAAAVIYLASPESSYITGETLHVNGGMAML